MNSRDLWIDMHFHTNLSDGRLSNAEIIKRILKIGWFFVATDHDLVNSEFESLAKAIGITSTEWVEISILDKNYWYFHITAYAKNFRWEILDILENTRNWRRSKIYKQIRVLQKNWILINEDAFFSFFEDKWINVFNLNIYHLASYVYKFKQNISHVKNITWVEMDKIEFLKRCLRDEWDFSCIWAATVPEYTPDISDIIRIVKENDWMTSIAHPNFSFKQDEYRKRIEYFLWLWMDGIEINSRATREQIDIARACLKKENLFTFWSDCHFTAYSEADHWDFWEISPDLDEETIAENIEKIISRLN
ncbi:MAG: hypothetical protein ACD_3C00086G0068 [uncultured bacterium (gcode 4)]|uniref:Polymerase/histidinol phosphatase N-terminal domain-containing protein n=1 Tax=uncultured bacterium (gcode 4) TaxID=1234023 RepID=K2GDC2_9BACT|nr:MAG: hypothetical protein ACD_3C00086G0068 [uncultured bacterium (gcode 4)]